MREGGEGGRVIFIESTVFLLKNSMIFDVFFFFFRFGLLSILGGVGWVCEGLVGGGGGAVVCEGVGGGGGGLVELPMQPSDCRGGGVGPIVLVKGGVSVSEGEGGGGGGPRGVPMQLSACRGGGGKSF